MPHSDPHEAKAYYAKRYRENRDAVLIRVKKRSEEKRDQILAYQRNRYVENAEEINAKTRALRAENPEIFRTKDRERHKANPERKRANDRARYERDKEKRKERSRQHAKNNPDARYDAQQRRRALKAGAKAEKVLRADILDRDGPNCMLCGIETILPVRYKPAKNERHYDHKIPFEARRKPFDGKHAYLVLGL